MKDTNDILRFVLQRIGQVYQRPLMYGGTPEGLELILHYYHELVAEMLVCRAALNDLEQAAHSEAGATAAGFSTAYRRTHDGATDNEIADYIVLEWQKIDAAWGVSIPDVTSTD